MVLLRRVIGDALRGRRQGQQRTLREVSSAANVSLGYLSEIERGQKEASSELLASICDALGAQLSELLREASDTVALAEQMPNVLVPAQNRPAPNRPPNRPAQQRLAPERAAQPAGNRAAGNRAARERLAPERVAHPVEPAQTMADAAARIVTNQVGGVRRVSADGKISVSVRPDSALKATLRATRRVRPTDQDRNRDVVCVG
jgi:transcriptional regulator with XRE-family HTH domain